MNEKKEYRVGLNEIKQVSDVVKATYGFDFGHYALSSFQRRIIRVLTLEKFEDVNELCRKLKKDENFYDDFLKEITVNTTEMFRDPSMWRALKETMAEEFKNRTSVKIWHAGCSSGEEVYSMCILLKELGLYDKTTLYATDINTKVIDNAKKGVYPIRNMELNEANYSRFKGSKTLKDYYNVVDNKAVMDANLLKNVTFRVHNLAMDAAFNKFDIILCRNVMIYFDKVLQDTVFKLFHSSLFNYSHLVIGAKESMIWCSINSKFKIVNDKEKIYQVVV